MTSTLDKPLVTSRPGPDEDSTEGQDHRLLTGYLHKTSNTLCGIKGYASLIADRDTTGPDAGLWARKIIAEVERMEEIFRSVGDLTRGRGDPDVGVDLAGLVADVAAGFRGEHAEVSLKLGAIPEGEIRLPAADLTLLLTELFRNAAESGPLSGTKVQVVVGGWVDPEGRVFLTVEDDGCGMDPDLARQAPDPFVTTKDHHHGVGLTRVATLMDMYGLGWNLSSQEGSGTRVELEVAESP